MTYVARDQVTFDRATYHDQVSHKWWPTFVRFIRYTKSILFFHILFLVILTLELVSFLDLFAGVGAIGLEALSRGAKEVFFVEHDKKQAATIRANIALLQEETRCHLLVQDVFKALAYLVKQKRSFDIIFADPPYGTNTHSLTNEVLEMIDQSTLLKKEGSLFLEDHERASTYTGHLTRLAEHTTRTISNITLRHFI